jgi:hypothetical protein
MGRRVRIILSLLTGMITCVTLVSLTVSLYHVNSITNTMVPNTVLLSPASPAATNRNRNGLFLSSEQFQRDSLSDFQRRRPPSSVAQSASTLETPDQDESKAATTKARSDSIHNDNKARSAPDLATTLSSSTAKTTKATVSSPGLALGAIKGLQYSC